LEYVTIIHPHHPLHGQRCEIIRMRRGIDPDLIVRLPDGSHAAIALSWTDYGEEQASTKTQNNHDLPLLDLQGLRQISQLVEHLRQEGRVPTRRRRTPHSRPARRTLRGGNH
jgi:hypothetical protein